MNCRPKQVIRERKDIHMEIGKLDRNLHITSTITDKDLLFRDVQELGFGLHGLCGPGYRRMPADTAALVSDGVARLSLHTAGGRLRFVTDSDCVAIRTVQHTKHLMTHMTFVGSSGFDLYVRCDDRDVFCGSFLPPLDREDGYESVLNFPTRSLRQFTINFPLYDGVDGLELGLRRDAVLQPAPDYRIKTPVVFYGSSITQGGCASRPGNSYEAMLSRWLDFDYVNLGFSGNAKGEAEMAQYISKLDMSALVIDYDYNAPDADHLRRTHEPFFSIIRQSRPELPVLILPNSHNTVWPEKRRTLKERRDIVRQTFENACAAGDRQVYWMEGSDFSASFDGPEGTVDGVHPNDLGFYCMAKTIRPVLAQMLDIHEKL